MKRFESKYLWTPALVARLRQAYALPRVEKSAAIDALEVETGWPRSAFVNKAGSLGLCATRREWTAEEDAAIRASAGEVGPDKIARALGRSRYAVMHRARLMGLANRVRAGYSVRDLVDIFGVPVARVIDWIETGKLPAQETNAGRRVSDEVLVRFIRQFPREYSFRLADEVFLKGVLFEEQFGLSAQAPAHAARRGRKKKAEPRGSAGRRWGGLAGGGDAGNAGALPAEMGPAAAAAPCTAA